MQFKHIAVTSAAAIAFGVSFSASAAVVNFDQANAQAPDGSVSYDGTGGALTGSDISFDQISLNGGNAPAGNESQLNCVSCSINFTTGGNVEEGPNVWSFGGGGNLTLNGEAQDSSGNTVASGDLFGGTFDGGPNEAAQLVTGNGEDSLSATLSGTDDFNDSLASYFGISEDTSFDFTNTVIALGSASFDGDGGFSSENLQNADVVARPTQSVPAPSELGLFAAGLAMVAGVMGFRRRQNGSDV